MVLLVVDFSVRAKESTVSSNVFQSSRFFGCDWTVTRCIWVTAASTSKILPVHFVISFVFITHSGGGISSYAGQQGAAGQSLVVCLDKAVKDIPKERHRLTPVYLGATAGMRLLKWVSVCLSVLQWPRLFNSYYGLYYYIGFLKIVKLHYGIT